jgi:hypothetical protein
MYKLCFSLCDRYVLNCKLRVGVLGSIRYVNSEVPVRFLKSKQGYTVRKSETYKRVEYVLIGAGLAQAV